MPNSLSEVENFIIQIIIQIINYTAFCLQMSFSFGLTGSYE